MPNYVLGDGNGRAWIWMEAYMLRVLVVDDDESVRRLLTLVLPLGVSGPEVVGSANDGVEAVEQARRLKPDLIILDHMMPVRSGADSIPHLLRECPDAEILMFSAYLDSPQVGDEIRDVASEHGVQTLAKGSIDGLEAAVSRIAQARAKRHTN